jgi:hypothetical protein
MNAVPTISEKIAMWTSFAEHWAWKVGEYRAELQALALVERDAWRAAQIDRFHLNAETNAVRCDLRRRRLLHVAR